MRHLLTIDELGREGIDEILERADHYEKNGIPRSSSPPFVVLAFFEPSTRTRIGFASATARLGGQFIDLEQTKFQSSMSCPESIEDTARAVSGMADLIVLRHPDPDKHRAFVENSVCPVINAGCGRESHPTQALIDAYAMQRLAGGIDGKRIGIVGDCMGRAATSLISLLDRFSPQEIRLLAPAKLTPVLPAFGATGADPYFEQLDIIYAAGFPALVAGDHYPDHMRRRYCITDLVLSNAFPHTTVLCPMPCVDEIDATARADQRILFFEQSDFSIQVRAAILTMALTRTPS